MRLRKGLDRLVRGGSRLLPDGTLIPTDRIAGTNTSAEEKTIYVWCSGNTTPSGGNVQFTSHAKAFRCGSPMSSPITPRPGRCHAESAVGALCAIAWKG